jgi:O-antigen/teichoic acid export membrane protein
MKIRLFQLLIGVPLAFLLIPVFGITGAIVGTIISGVPNVILGLYWMLKHYQVTVDWGSSGKIFIASAIAAVTTYLSLDLINGAEWIRLVIGGTVFLAVYIFTAPIIGAISQSDINNLRTMFSGLGIISRLIEIPLRLAEKTARNTSRASRQQESDILPSGHQYSDGNLENEN